MWKPHLLPLCLAGRRPGPDSVPASAWSWAPVLPRRHRDGEQERMLVERAGPSEGCLAMSTLGNGLLRQPVLSWSLRCRQGAPVAAGPTRWRAPSRCPGGDHLVDGLFSHGCESRGMEEKGFVGANPAGVRQQRKGVCGPLGFPSPRQALNLLLERMAGSSFPLLGTGASLCLRVQHHTAGASASLPLAASRGF